MSIAPEASRRRVFVFAMFIAVLFGAIALWNYWANRDIVREGSSVVSRSGERLEMGKVPKRYTATFRYENRAGGKLRVTTEKFWANRPFQSRGETYIGSNTTGQPSSIRQSNFGVLASTSQGSSQPLNIAVPPSLGSGDLRLDAALDEAVRTKLLVVREQREVFGRRCQVYRAGSSVLAGDIPRYEPGKGDYADVCIDRNGIVIEEYWVQDEELLRRRVATELEVNAPINRSVFEIDIESAPGMDRGLIERITEPVDAPLWRIASSPKGFERLGRYAVVLSPSAVPSPSGRPPPVGPSSTVDVYVNGPDLVVVDQDPSLAILVSFENRPAEKVEVDELEDAELLIDGRQSEIRGRTADRSYARIYGTIPPDDLVELANSLEQSQE